MRCSKLPKKYVSNLFHLFSTVVVSVFFILQLESELHREATISSMTLFYNGADLFGMKYINETLYIVEGTEGPCYGVWGCSFGQCNIYQNPIVDFVGIDLRATTHSCNDTLKQAIASVEEDKKYRTTLILEKICWVSAGISPLFLAALRLWPCKQTKKKKSMRI